MDHTTYQYVRQYGDMFSFNPMIENKRFPKGTLYQYSLELVNNQFASNIVSDSFVVPDVIPTNSGMISHVSDSVLRKFTNRSITGSINLTSTDLVIDINTGT